MFEKILHKLLTILMRWLRDNEDQEKTALALQPRSRGGQETRTRSGYAVQCGPSFYRGLTRGSARVSRARSVVPARQARQSDCRGIQRSSRLPVAAKVGTTAGPTPARARATARSTLDVSRATRGAIPAASR